VAEHQPGAGSDAGLHLELRASGSQNRIAGVEPDGDLLDVRIVRVLEIQVLESCEELDQALSSPVGGPTLTEGGAEDTNALEVLDEVECVPLRLDRAATSAAQQDDEEQA
jgi:hypothetical protein